MRLHFWFALAAVAVLLLLESQTVSRAATFALTNADAINTSSFNSGLNWANGAAPAAGNAYQTSTFRLRTPANTTAVAFAGASLELQSGGGELRHKTGATVTINNLIVDNGAIVDLTAPSGSTPTGALAGSITLTGTATFQSGISTDANGASHQFTIGSVLGGTGGFNTTGSFGTIILAATNNYSGATTVSGGTVMVNGVLANSAVTVSSGTLGGNGVIRGAVTIQSGGTLQPGLGGTDTSILTVSNTVSLAGTTLIALDRTNSIRAAKITGVTTLTQGGTLTVTNVGPALVAGDTFSIFGATTYAGAFGAINLPALAAGLVWSNSIVVNGALTVVATGNLPIVSNAPASSVFATSATFNGQIISAGISTPNVTIFYGTTDGGTNAMAWGNSISIGSVTGSFSASVAALTTNTTYYFAAMASNSAGISWAQPSLAFATLAANPVATRVPVLTYHYDNTRQAQNANETLLTPANVNSNSFGKLFSYAVDGYIYTEPLVMTNVTIPGQGVHDVVFVATEHDTLYAFDANSNAGTNGGLLWKTNFGLCAVSATAPFGGRYTGGGYTDILPEVGTTGTPVIDPVTGTIYVDAFTRDIVGNVTNFVHRLHALDVTTGNERPYGPVIVAGSVPGAGFGSTNGVQTFSAIQHNQRPALALVNGILYVAYAGYADTDPYHGWLFGYSATNLALQTNYVFNTTPNARTAVFGSHAAEGGIWMGGGGICADPNNNIYFETGNGSFSANTNGGDYADTILKLSTTNGLAIADYFTPNDQQTLANNDTDLGSCGPILLPDAAGNGTHPHLLVGLGKSGKIYLLDRDTLTAGNVHFQTGSDSEILESFVGVGGCWSQPAYWNNLLFFQPSSGAMKSFSISNASINQTATATAPASFGAYNGSPVVSANGTNNGIVWVINGNSGNSASAGTLYAFNATNISQMLWSSAQIAARDGMGNGIKMTTPTVAGGKVFVGGQYTLSIYGLATFLPTPTISPAGGVFNNSVTVTLADVAPGAAIYYTLDGTVPTANSTLYTGPFAVSTTTTVSAIAVQAGYVNSAVAIAGFINSQNLPPPPWQTSDVGSVAAAGSAYFSNGVFIVSGSGADIWNTADGFRFVYQPVTNGCDISARVTSQSNTDPWAKAGVMIRDSLGASAAYGYMPITIGNGFDFQYRSQNGIASDGNISGGALNAAPNNWVRLTRTNNVFTAYISADGVNWTPVGSPTTLALTNAVYYAGLAVTAHNDGVLGTADLDNVALNGVSYRNPPPAVVLTAPASNSVYTAVASVTFGADADALYDTIAAVNFYVNSTFIGSVSNAPYAATATGLAAGNYSLTAVAVSSSGLMSTSAPVNITVVAGSGQPYGSTNRGTAAAYFNMPTTSAGPIPALLSLTGIFSNTPGMTPAAGLISYTPNVPLWSDGAVKTRYVAVPNNGGAMTPDEQIAFAQTGPWTFPAGTVFVKTFQLNTDTSNSNVLHRLETRLLVRDINGAVYGVTYKWRADNSDADLLSSSLYEDIAITNASGVSTQTWYYPSPSDCLTCHTPVANYVLGLSTRQLNGSQTYATGVSDNQLRTMNRLGLFSPAFDETNIANFEKLSALGNTNASFQDRARSYLDANCAQCHQPGGAGITFDARYDTPLANQNLINGALDSDGFAMIKPRDIWRTEIRLRMNTTNSAVKMPPLARQLIDSNAVAVIEGWVNSLPGTPALAPVVISPNGGSFFNHIAIALQPPDTNAAIYYTLDGTAPTTNALLYSGALNLTRNATVSASAFETNYINSATASAFFVVQPVQFLSQNFSNGIFQMQFIGAPGSNYVLQVSSNLVNWASLATNPAGTNLINFVDPKSSNYPDRFYRVLQQ